jgi:hypothetical protein
MKYGSTEKKKKVKLQISNEINFTLIGLSSHENDYRLVWALNSKLFFEFTRMADLVVHHPKLKTDLEFSRYIHTDEDKYLVFYLIANRCPDGFLFPELKNLDYLIQINGEITEGEKTQLTKKLKTVEVISACFSLEPANIKEIRNILQE